MIPFDQKRRIIYLCLTLTFILSLILLTTINMKTWPFFRFLDISFINSNEEKKFCLLRPALAEALEVTYKSLWHTTGLPDDVPLNKPQGFCLDPEFSQIYVADTENDRVIMFSLDGHAVGQFLISRPINRPFDIVFDPNGLIYISQIEKKAVEVFNRKGLWQASIPKDPTGKGLEIAPGRMEFDLQGRLMVIDRSAGMVWAMTRQGKVLKKIYEYSEKKKVSLLTGLAVDSSGKIFVTSGQGVPVVTVMNPEGAPIFSFGRHGALYNDSFSFPNSLDIDDKGRMWVVDTFRHTIKVFDPDGKYLFSIGELGKAPGRFMFPVDIHIDRDGRVYVLEKGAGRLQAFSVVVKEE